MTKEERIQIALGLKYKCDRCKAMDNLPLGTDKYFGCLSQNICVLCCRGLSCEDCRATYKSNGNDD